MYLYAAKQLKNIKHTFLEVGHSQNERDYIHSTIERASKYKNIYTPSMWELIDSMGEIKGKSL